MSTTITNGTTLVTQIENFLGLNQSETGQTNLKLGEASLMRNFRITHDYKLQKMYGYKSEFTTTNNRNVIINVWCGKLGDTEAKVLFRTNSDNTGLFYWDFLNNRGNSSTSTSFNATKLLFEFNKKLYFQYSNKFMTYDGTTFSDATAYAPVVKITCTPAGSGEDFEGLNMLSQYRRVWFSADGESTAYTLPETNIGSITSITIDDTATTAYTVNKTTGVVTFTTAPTKRS